MALSNSQYDALMRVYQQRQLDNKRDQDKRIQEVYETVPEVAELSDQIAALMARAARKMVWGTGIRRGSLKSRRPFCGPNGTGA